MTELLMKVGKLISSEAAVKCPVSPDDAVCSSVCLRKRVECIFGSRSAYSASHVSLADASRFTLQTQALHKLHSDCNSMRCAEHCAAGAKELVLLT
jgi:hypothetical protein